MTVARAMSLLVSKLSDGYIVEDVGVVVPVYTGFKRDAVTDTYLNINVYRLSNRDIVVIRAGQGTLYATIVLYIGKPWGYGYAEIKTYMGHMVRKTITHRLNASQIEKILNNLRRLLEGGRS